MAHLQRSRASLRIAGDSLVPEDVTRLLRATPTHAQAKGQVMSTRSGATRVAKFGQWRLHATPSEPENLNAQVEEILGKLTVDLEVWQSLSSRFSVDLFCGWFMGSSNEGVSVSRQTLQALGERGIELAIDIYGPDADA